MQDQPIGIIPAEIIWSKTPMDIQDEWLNAVTYLSELEKTIHEQVYPLKRELQGLKGKGALQKRKDIENMIETLFFPLDEAKRDYHNKAFEEGIKLRDMALEKAKAAGIREEEELDQFADDFLLESSTERPYIEYNYNKTVQQIFDDVLGHFLNLYIKTTSQTKYQQLSFDYRVQNACPININDIACLYASNHSSVPPISHRRPSYYPFRPCGPWQIH